MIYSKERLTSLLAVCCLVSAATAQIGTITQDVISMSVFGFQKDCARECFVSTGICPYDVLGSQIGCKSASGCNKAGWQATNDCYCRSDLQEPAQDYLTSCISRYCTVGDFSIDASSAGSIYGQYCREKGYSSAVKPATVPATTTKGSGAQTGTATGGAGPTATSITDSGSPSSGSNKLSISTIIGIIVGSLAGLAFLAFVLKTLRGCVNTNKNKPPAYQQHPYVNLQQPTYPMQTYHQPYYPEPSPMEQEVSPDDSVSVVAGGPSMPQPAPTLVSAANYPRRF